jgi:hypothetical protein
MPRQFIKPSSIYLTCKFLVPTQPRTSLEAFSTLNSTSLGQELLVFISIYKKKRALTLLLGRGMPMSLNLKSMSASKLEYNLKLMTAYFIDQTPYIGFNNISESTFQDRVVNGTSTWQVTEFSLNFINYNGCSPFCSPRAILES